MLTAKTHDKSKLVWLCFKAGRRSSWFNSHKDDSCSEVVSRFSSIQIYFSMMYNHSIDWGAIKSRSTCFPCPNIPIPLSFLCFTSNCLVILLWVVMCAYLFTRPSLRCRCRARHYQPLPLQERPIQMTWSLILLGS